MIDLAAISAAADRIRPHVVRTPVVRLTPGGLRLKAENLQHTGAFKLRGAFNAILSLSAEQRARGVVAHSSGNHSQAVAYAAHVLGVRATIVMPDNAPALKLANTRQWGPDLVIVGSAFTERANVAAQIAQDRGLAPIEPYDDPAIVAGAGTVGLEIAEDCSEIDAVFVQASGGGLAAGVATAIKALRPNVQVIAVEPALCGHVTASLARGERVAIPDAQSGRTIADGMRANQLGAANWPAIHEHVDHVMTVEDDAMRAGIARLARDARLVAEPSGATAMMAALASGVDPARAVAIVSGGNLDPATLAAILAA